MTNKLLGAIVIVLVLAAVATPAHASVKDTIDSVFTSFMRGDLPGVLRFVNERYVLYTENVHAPWGGIHHGSHGLSNYFAKVNGAIETTDFHYNIDAVDEARGTCVMTSTISGTFKSTGESFTASARHWITMDLIDGTILRHHITDLDPDVYLEALHTPAEKVFWKLTNLFWLEGPSSTKAMDFIADDCEWSVAGTPKDFHLPMKIGKNGFKEFFKSTNARIDFTMSDFTILYADDKTLFAEISFSKYLIKNSGVDIAPFTSHLEIRVNSKGLLDRYTILPSRMLMPWEMGPAKPSSKNGNGNGKDYPQQEEL